MGKKQIMNQLNSQKGITAADAIIGLLIILTSLGVIAMIYSNLVIGSREIDRTTGATRIATNLLEHMEMVYYDQIEFELKSLADTGKISVNNNIYSISGSQEGTTVFLTTIPAGYTVNITLQNLEKDSYDLIKEVMVEVKYNVGEQAENVKLSKVFERETIRECNSPKLDEEYLSQLGITNENAIYSYENPEHVGEGTNIICPIKYNGENYEIITDPNAFNTMWYSYSNKQWARVLVLTANEYAECINDAAQISEKLKNSEKSYLWIPRFGVENGGNLLGNTYFKYKNTDFAILNSYDLEEFNLLYRYLDLKKSIQWSNSYGLAFQEENQELVGIWSQYAALKNINSEAYKLNHSQYGPLLEY